MNFFTKLFLGSNRPENRPKKVYARQLENLGHIWNNRTYNDFGVERILRLLLQLFSFIMPGTLIRHLAGTKELLSRKIFIEIYSVAKLCWFILLFKLDLTTSTLAVWISVIFTIDTIHFLVSRIFLNDVHQQPISFKRTLLMSLLNFVEVALCFAFIYSYIDDTNNDPTKIIFSTGQHLTDLQTIYFSFVTSATIGYGDIAPKDPLLMKLVILQIILSLFFVVIVISTITNKLGDDTFYNKRKKTYR